MFLRQNQAAPSLDEWLDTLDVPVEIAIVSDAWKPQVNGVVTFLTMLQHGLKQRDRSSQIISPQQFQTLPLPTHPDIALALFPYKRLTKILDHLQPAHIHIATEGPLGHAGIRYCRTRQRMFTTSYHTQFPEYIHAYTGFPIRLSYAWLRRFHQGASHVFCSTAAVQTLLAQRGFKNLTFLERGVDETLFQPRDKDYLSGKRPIALYVGRVAREKNIKAFLEVPFHGTKYVVGDGNSLAWARKAYPEIQFLGVKHGLELAQCYAAADVFVFPSLLDTFGLVLLEALACGTPIAAYPLPGILQRLHDNEVAILDTNLEVAIERALTLPREKCREFILANFSWDTVVDSFLNATLHTP